MQKNNSKINTVIFAFGFMGNSVFQNLLDNKLFEIKGLILPNKDQLYFDNINKKKINKKIDILYSDKQNDVYRFIKKIDPDIVLISTFNKILDKKILKLSKFINIHHGKLPKQKGRASINWAIISGRKEIYITFHEVVPKLDSGKIILQKKIIISKNDNYLKIQDKISLFLKQNISLIIKKYIENKYRLKKNNSGRETWNCSRNPEDSMVNFFDKRKNIFNLIRSSDGQKFGAFCFLDRKSVV